MRRLLSSVALAGLVAGAAIALGGEEASAKASYDSAYGFERTWNASMRLVRVDLGLKIEEKDDQAGYLLFDYKSSESGSKVTQGSMELVRPREAGGAVHVIVQLPQMPRYHEQVLIDSLAKKLKDEYGEPPKQRPRPAPPDAGNDSGE
jgi:hypothetical protein